MRSLTRNASVAASDSKSASVQRWMLGVSCHGCGSVGECGMRPRSASPVRRRQCAKFGKETMPTGATRIIPATTVAG